MTVKSEIPLKKLNSLFQTNNTFHNEHFISELENSILKLDKWISDNGWAGYDPYDIKGSKVYMWAFGLDRTPIIKNVFRKFVLGFLLIGEMLFPRVFRIIFNIKKTINPKGMALLGQAYLKLYLVKGDDKYKIKGLECIDWLKDNQSPGYKYPCWGYPFDWDSEEVIVKAYTPSGVVVSAVSEVFWLAWTITNDRSYLDICEGTCNFFLNYLNIDHIDDETVCFSYTPLDKFHVHNANLLVVEILVKVGLELNKKEWVNIGLKAGNYALTEQNEDGSLYYYGKVDNSYNPNRVDHYHTGFEIRCLYSIYKHTQKMSYKKAVDRYYQFYIKNLVDQTDEKTAIKMYPHSLYPINIHSCAEALLMNSTMAYSYPEARNLLKQILPWINNMMQSKRGYYYYMHYKLGPITLKSTIPYMRWGQSWMMLSLATSLESAHSFELGNRHK